MFIQSNQVREFPRTPEKTRAISPWGEKATRALP